MANVMAYVEKVETLGKAVEDGQMTMDEAAKELQAYAARLGENAPKNAVVANLRTWRTIRRDYERISREEGKRSWKRL